MSQPYKFLTSTPCTCLCCVWITISKKNKVPYLISTHGAITHSILLDKILSSECYVLVVVIVLISQETNEFYQLKLQGAVMQFEHYNTHNTRRKSNNML